MLKYITPSDKYVIEGSFCVLNLDDQVGNDSITVNAGNGRFKIDGNNENKIYLFAIWDVSER